MSQANRKPTHRLVRYYGTGTKPPRAEVGAMWTNDDGSTAIRIDLLSEQIWVQAFPIEAAQE